MAINFDDLAKIVKQVKEKDTEAITKLYEYTYQKLYFLAFSMLKNQEDAQDAVQESYIKILSGISSLKNDRIFIAWANKITYNICIRMLSKKTDFAVEDEVLMNISDDNESNDPLAVATTSESSVEMTNSLNRLDPILRATLVFKYYQDLKIAQIAKIMNCPEGTVKSRLNMAKKVLKKELEKEGVGYIG